MKYFLVSIGWYWLAILSYILLGIMFLTIILAPVALYISEESDWFDEPLYNARFHIDQWSLEHDCYNPKD